MPKFEVTITRTRTEIASVSITAKDAEAAEEKVRQRIELPAFDLAEDASVTAKKEKAALRYFEDHLSESADHTTEFEYEVEEA